MDKYYYAQLSNREQHYYKKVLDAMLAGRTNVKSSIFLNTQNITKVVRAVNYDHPELYYIDFQHLEFCGISTSVILQISYNYRPALKVLLDSELEKRVKKIIGLASRSNLQSKYEKYRWIHDYLVRHVHYNHAAVGQPDKYPDSFGIKGVLLDSYAVCEGISKAFKYLCDKFGLDALIVRGTASQVMFGENIPHAWNMVRFNGDYVHVDVTWDIGLSTPCKYMRYDYFCISDKWITMDHVYESYPACTTDNFSYFKKCGRLFLSGKDLGRYIDGEIRSGKTTLYFKVEAPFEKLSTIQMKIQERLDKSILKHLWSKYTLEMVPNEKQMCFLYKARQG